MSNTKKYLDQLIQSDNEIRSLTIKKYSIDSFESFEIFNQNNKLYQRLKLVVTNDNFYEADQLYKTIHFRCMNNNLIDEALDLLFHGIVYFSSKNSHHCAFDLSKVFVETLKKSNIKSLSRNLRNKIKVIHESLGNNVQNGVDEERSEFSVSILKWSSSLFNKIKLDVKNEHSIFINYQSVFGHFDIHNDFAINLWKEKNYVQARYHFLHSLDAESFAHMIIECHLNFGYPSEYGLFLVQAVLQFLSLRNLKSAKEFFSIYTKNHPLVKKSKLNQEFFESQYINFVSFLLLTIQDENLKSFKTILETYKKSIEIESSLNTYLDRIGEYFFNIRKNKPESGGMLSNLMRMLTSNATNSDSISSINSTKNLNKSESDKDQDDWDSFRDVEDNDLLD